MNGRLPQGLSAESSPFGPFVAQKEHGVADFDFGVRNLAFDFKTADFLRAQGLLIKVDSLGNVCVGQTRCGNSMVGCDFLVMVGMDVLLCKSDSSLLLNSGCGRL